MSRAAVDNNVGAGTNLEGYSNDGSGRGIGNDVDCTLRV